MNNITTLKGEGMCVRERNTNSTKLIQQMRSLNLNTPLTFQ